MCSEHRVSFLSEAHPAKLGAFEFMKLFLLKEMSQREDECSEQFMEQYSRELMTFFTIMYNLKTVCNLRSCLDTTRIIMHLFARKQAYCIPI